MLYAIDFRQVATRKEVDDYIHGINEKYGLAGKKAMHGFYDVRNGIYTALTPGIQSDTLFINYWDLLNKNRTNWRNKQYLDMGYLPLTYFPIFKMNTVAMYRNQFSKISDVIQQRASGAETAIVPVFSLMGNSIPKSFAMLQDILIRREDARRIFGTDKLEEVFLRCR